VAKFQAWGGHQFFLKIRDARRPPVFESRHVLSARVTAWGPRPEYDCHWTRPHRAHPGGPRPAGGFATAFLARLPKSRTKPCNPLLPITRTMQLPAIKGEALVMSEKSKPHVKFGKKAAPTHQYVVYIAQNTVGAFPSEFAIPSSVLSVREQKDVVLT